MNSKSIYSLVVAIVLLFSCKNDNKTAIEPINSEMETMADNSMNSLDWEGTYEGLLPCGDCEGIKTIVTINNDNTYVTKEIYVGKDDKPFESKGTFKWDDKGQRILFSDKTHKSYFVGENTLTHLDKEGNKITGDLAKNYVLKKVNDELVGKKWHLVSFKGEEIQQKEAKAEHAFVEFSEDFIINGYTGCNNLRGGYTLKDGHKIKFSQLISTKRFCPEMETENEFLSALNKATYYNFEDHALVIHDTEHQRLATFKMAN